MKELRCGDFVAGCEATFRGATEDEVLAQGTEHAREAHGMTEMPPEVVEQVRAAITDAD